MFRLDRIPDALIIGFARIRGEVASSIYAPHLTVYARKQIIVTSCFCSISETNSILIGQDCLEVFLLVPVNASKQIAGQHAVVGRAVAVVIGDDFIEDGVGWHGEIKLVLRLRLEHKQTHP